MKKISQDLFPAGFPWVCPAAEALIAAAGGKVRCRHRCHYGLFFGLPSAVSPGKGFDKRGRRGNGLKGFDKGVMPGWTETEEKDEEGDEGEGEVLEELEEL